MNRWGKQETNKMVHSNPNLQIVTLSLSGLNTPDKKQIVKLDNNQDPATCYLEETYINYKYIAR